MANWNDLFGGSGFTATSAVATITILAGATGTIATLPTPPAGQRIMLTALSSVGATLTSLTTITVGGSDIVTAVLLNGPTVAPTGANQLSIGFQAGSHPYILGGVGEIFELKTNAATSNDIVYAYQIGK